jgi:poly(beta-D-mannuronate) lyase
VTKIYSHIILLLIFSSVLYGQNVTYVSSASEISAAMSLASPGDTLIMVNGIWTDEHIIFSGNGTEQLNIVLKAETPGEVVLNGTSTLRIGGSYLTVSGLYFYRGYSSSGGVIEFRTSSSNFANNCRLTNTAIEDYNPASGSTEYKWISMFGDSNRVDHCYLKGKAHAGATFVVWLDGQPNYHLIDSNYFAYRPELGVNGGETIRVGTSTYSMTDSYSTIENNYFERCNGEIEIISSKSGHNTYRYNTFFECEGALTLRHGNFANVYGNFFIGNNKSRTGGVRIIGEDHKVYNNYFENLKGTSFRAALTMVNGVPNSPLNRYFQVKRAEVVNNTFVDCAETFIIGAGADAERTLPSLDCFISNNIAQSGTRLIEYDDEPINMTYEKNIMYGGPLGIDQPDGIKIIDPQLVEGADGLWRLADVSPAIDSGTTNYSYVLDDMDGQVRDSDPDIGSDEYSNDLIIRRPLTSDDVGPGWWPPPVPPLRVIQVQAGHDSLKNALTLINDEEIIELVTDGGIYTNSTDLEIINSITIRATSGLTDKPVIRNTNASASTRSVIVIRDGGSLNLFGVELDGMSGTSTPAKYLIRTDDNPMTESYNLIIDSCYFHDVSVDGNGNFFRAYEGTFADLIKITNTMFTNCGKEGIRLKDEPSQSMNYNVENFELSNCTFWDIPKEAIYIYGGDDVNFTPSPTIRIDHCTFDNCGYDSATIIRPDECDDTYISNSIISNNTSSATAVTLFGDQAAIAYCDMYEVGDIELNRNASIGNGMMDVDPLYMDRLVGDFTLPSNSLVLNKASDGSSMGDLRWAVNPRSFVTLTLAVFGEGSITADPDSTGLDYSPGTIVTLTAIPNTGYEFVQWGADASGTNPVTQITMDSDKDALAVFQPIVSVGDDTVIPGEYQLYQNYPNPFNPSTIIKYGVPTASNVELDIYNMNGEHVENIVNDFHSAGYYKISWTASSLPSGTYFIRMISENKMLARKILLIK